jgi:uncharacterized damage-inducible protein DinB
MDLLDRLLEHDRWATTQLLELSGSLDDDQLDREFDIGHRTLRETYAHMIYNVASWTGLMTGAPEVELPGSRSLPDLVAWDARASATFAGFARRIRDERRFDDTFTDAFAGPMTFGGAILHVILHNEGHRTEAVHILHRLGVPGDRLEVDHALWDYVRRGLFDPDAEVEGTW